MAFCIQCGRPFPVEANFCPRCGRGRYGVPRHPVGPPPTIEGNVGDASEPLRPLKDVMRQVEAAYIRRVLLSVGGHRARAADVLGISRKNLWEKMTEYGIADESHVPAVGTPTPVPIPTSAEPMTAVLVVEHPLVEPQSPPAPVLDVIELLARSGKTAEEVSRESGVPMGAIERVLAGEYLDPFTRLAVGRTLDVSEDDLLSAIRESGRRR